MRVQNLIATVILVAMVFLSAPVIFGQNSSSSKVLNLPKAGKLVITFANNDSTLKQMRQGQLDTLEVLRNIGTPIWLLPGHSSARFKKMSQNSSDRRNMRLANGRGRAVQDSVPNATLLPPKQMGRVVEVYWGKGPYSGTVVVTRDCDCEVDSVKIAGEVSRQFADRDSLMNQPATVFLKTAESLSGVVAYIYKLSFSEISAPVANTSNVVSDVQSIKSDFVNSLELTRCGYRNDSGGYYFNKFELQQGDYEVDFVCAGYYSITENFSIMKGRNVSVTANMISVPPKNSPSAQRIKSDTTHIFVGGHMSYDVTTRAGFNFEIDSRYIDFATIATFDKTSDGVYSLLGGYNIARLFKTDKYLGITPRAGVRIYGTDYRFTLQLACRYSIGPFTFGAFGGGEWFSEYYPPATDMGINDVPTGFDWYFKHNPGGISKGIRLVFGGGISWKF